MRSRSAGGGKLRFIGPQEKGDFDDDGDLDRADHAESPDCLAGPASGIGTGCEIFDFEPNADVDLTDFADFQDQFTGDLYQYDERRPRQRPDRLWLSDQHVDRRARAPTIAGVQ